LVFAHAVALVFQPESLAVKFAKVPPEMLQVLVADRSKLFSGGTAARVQLDQALHQWPAIVGRIDQQLQHQQGISCWRAVDCRLCPGPSLWFLKGSSVTAPLVDAYPAVTTWLERVLSLAMARQPR
jgi:glutathione S-transferase